MKIQLKYSLNEMKWESSCFAMLYYIQYKCTVLDRVAAGMKKFKVNLTKRNQTEHSHPQWIFSL